MSTSPRTCRDQNCAPVCPHIVITPTVEQQSELYRIIQVTHYYSEISDEVKDDLVNLVLKRGPYKEST
jgi:hypothetical protein